MNRINCLTGNFVVALLCFLLIFILACNKEQPVQPQPETPPPCDLPDELNTDILVPLSVGNWWKYEFTDFTGSKDSLTWRVFSDTLLNYQGQRYEAAISGWETSDRRWFEANGDDGFYNLGGISSDDTLMTRFVERKYPAIAGESWQMPRLAFNTITKAFYYPDTVLVTCIATDQQFETPAGTFECYVYHYKETQEHALAKNDIYLYYRPGIGWVGRQTISESSGFVKSKYALYQCRIR